jgi:hypothetical protein
VSATRRYTNDTTVQANATSLLATLLNQYFYPNPNASQGVFNLSEGPWWESGTIWQTYMDFAQYTGDETFSETVGAALTSASYNETHDYLGENHNYTQTVESRWNDDIMWYALAGMLSGRLLWFPWKEWMLSRPLQPLLEVKCTDRML